MLPNFVVIGSMKCGTTALWHYLRMHPEIFVPRRKDLAFFITQDDWPKGVDWYQSFFQTDDANIKALGEVSAEYTKYPTSYGVATNMASVLPDAKLIYLIRHPIDRIQSHYIHMVGVTIEQRGINTALEDVKNNPYVDCSRYYFQLEQFLPYYPKKRILVVSQEDLKNKRDETLQKIFKFIGVNPEVKIINEVRANIGAEKREWNYLGRPIRRSDKYFNYYNYYKSKLPRTMSVIERLINKPVPSSKINTSTRNTLIKILRPDLEKLHDFFELDFPIWEV